MMARKDNKKKSKFSIWGWLVAALVLVGGGFGVTQGGWLDGGLGDGTETTETTTNETSSIGEGNEEAKHVNITISQSDILWDNEAVTEDEVETRVSDEEDSTTYTVTDDNAIKATYDSVIETLTDSQADFQEAEEQS